MSAEENMPIRKHGRRPKHATPGREALLDAAYRTFARRGYEGSSLRDVAAQSNVDVALVARLFGSKAKLWEAVVERLAGFMLPHLLAIGDLQTKVYSSDQTKREIATLRMTDLIGLFGSIGRQVPEFPAFVIPEMVDPGPRFEHLQQCIMSKLWQASEPIVTDAIMSGCVRIKHPFLLFFTLLQGLSFPIMIPSLFWDLDSNPINSEQMGAQLVEHMASMVISEK